eukprot:GFYU01015612.1.p1 GENE.GFYU01015612.1~~GFYU01015612.1.p1  ORF type:complete len:496 (-),score=131.91 GFYU01015612.1:107-1594(-)
MPPKKAAKGPKPPAEITMLKSEFMDIKDRADNSHIKISEQLEVISFLRAQCDKKDARIRELETTIEDLNMLNDETSKLSNHELQDTRDTLQHQIKCLEMELKSAREEVTACQEHHEENKKLVMQISDMHTERLNLCQGYEEELAKIRRQVIMTKAQLEKEYHTAVQKQEEAFISKFYEEAAQQMAEGGDKKNDDGVNLAAYMQQKKQLEEQAKGIMELNDRFNKMNADYSQVKIEYDLGSKQHEIQVTQSMMLRKQLAEANQRIEKLTENVDVLTESEQQKMLILEDISSIKGELEDLRRKYRKSQRETEKWKRQAQEMADKYAVFEQVERTQTRAGEEGNPLQTALQADAGSEGDEGFDDDETLEKEFQRTMKMDATPDTAVYDQILSIWNTNFTSKVNGDQILRNHVPGGGTFRGKRAQTPDVGMGKRGRRGWDAEGRPHSSASLVRPRTGTPSSQTRMKKPSTPGSLQRPHSSKPPASFSIGGVRQSRFFSP